MKFKYIFPILGLFLAVVLVCGSVSAVELTVGNSTVSNETDSIIKVPVILKNDVDFAAFEMSVDTDIPGVHITLDPERPLEGWQFVGKETGDAINVVAFSLGSTTEPEVHLFTLDVNITDSEVASVPLKLTLYTVGLANNSILSVDQIKTTNLANHKISEKISASVTTDLEEYVKPVATSTPSPTSALVSTRSPTETQTPVPASTSSPGPSESPSGSSTDDSASAGVSVNTDASSASQKASSPGFTIVGSVLGLIGAGILLRKRSKMN